MTDQRLGGIALIAGTLGMLVTMAFHPTAHDFAPGAADAGARMIAVHWLAIAALASGYLRMDAHGFGLVVLAQAIWMVGAGIDLWRA